MEMFWPANLPQTPLVDDYRHATANNTITFKTEYGPPRMRRRTSANVSRRVWTFYLNRAMRADGGEVVDQFKMFQDFLEITEGFSFWFPDPTNPAQYIKVRFQPASEETGVEFVPDSRDFWRVTVQVTDPLHPCQAPYTDIQFQRNKY